MEWIIVLLYLSLVGLIVTQRRERHHLRQMIYWRDRGAFSAGVMFAMDRIARGVTPDRLIDQAREETSQSNFDFARTAEQIADSPSSIFNRHADA